MSKYIDSEKLIAKLRKHLIPTVLDREYDEWEMGKDAGLQQAIGLVESIKQPEVDLKEEFHRWLSKEKEEWGWRDTSLWRLWIISYRQSLLRTWT